MIRQVDPDRPITLMSPDVYMGPIKEVAEDYGGIFHDTGGMAGSWGDMHPVMVQSMGLPSDCEPGSGAVDLDDFKRFMGRWLTEGTQGVDYFHAYRRHPLEAGGEGAISSSTLPLWHLIGKYHVPQAELAVMLQRPQSPALRLSLEQQRGAARPGPAQSLLGTGLQPGGRLSPRRGPGAGFRPRQGGPLPRHSRRQYHDPGPRGRRRDRKMGPPRRRLHHLSPDRAAHLGGPRRLAHLQADRLCRHAASTSSRPTATACPAAGSAWPRARRSFTATCPSGAAPETGAGLSLKKIDPACEDLLLWDDGAVAAGVRRLGKGMVFDLGSNSIGAAVPGPGVAPCEEDCRSPAATGP